LPVVALASVGILMVYSASAIHSYALSRNAFQMVAPQIGAGLAGLATMIVLARVDYRYLRKVSLVLAIAALALLVAVLIPWFGASYNGASRWIQLGPFFEIHPAEVAKLALVVYLSHWLATRGTQIRSFFHGTVPFWIIVVPFLVLIAVSPTSDDERHRGHRPDALLRRGSAALPPGDGARRWRRRWRFPGAVPRHVPAHTDPGLPRPVGRSEWKRRANDQRPGGSVGRRPFWHRPRNDKVIVPYSYNDFIFSVIGQELGFVGGLVVIGLFVAIAWGGIRTALRAPDTFGGLLAAGVTAWICVQAIIHICVVLMLVPVTGITLPFVSQGGSSLVVSFAAVGILLSISRETVERGWVNASADRGRGYGRTYLPGSRGGSIVAGPTSRA